MVSAQIILGGVKHEEMGGSFQGEEINYASLRVRW
jgi:hypothetical protein